MPNRHLLKRQAHARHFKILGADTIEQVFVRHGDFLSGVTLR
jgi:hypothetical protein